jgi:hypothetical protein
MVRALARMLTLATIRPSRRWGTQFCYGLELGYSPMNDYFQITRTSVAKLDCRHPNGSTSSLHPTLRKRREGWGTQAFCGGLRVVRWGTRPVFYRGFRLFATR